VIVVDKVHDAFVEKLLAQVARFVNVGDPAVYGTYMGPVASDRAMKTILEYIEIGRKEGRLLTGGDACRAPTAVRAADRVRRRRADRTHRGRGDLRARARDHPGEGLRRALAIANNTEYGLTGAVYTKNAAKLQRAREEFFVGNLYLNRKCTGAMVGCHPFGGFNMSGTDSKAGGRDYLLLFLQGKSIAEKVG